MRPRSSSRRSSVEERDAVRVNASVHPATSPVSSVRSAPRARASASVGRSPSTCFNVPSSRGAQPRVGTQRQREPAGLVHAPQNPSSPACHTERAGSPSRVRMRGQESVHVEGGRRDATHREHHALHLHHLYGEWPETKPRSGPGVITTLSTMGASASLAWAGPAQKRGLDRPSAPSPGRWRPRGPPAGPSETSRRLGVAVQNRGPRPSPASAVPAGHQAPGLARPGR